MTPSVDLTQPITFGGANTRRAYPSDGRAGAACGPCVPASIENDEGPEDNSGPFSFLPRRLLSRFFSNQSFFFNCASFAVTLHTVDRDGVFFAPFMRIPVEAPFLRAAFS